MKAQLLGAAILIAVQAHAQIIYTDVVPDALYNVNGDTCHLDLNNDGSTDFYIRYYKKPGNACSGCTVGPPDLHPSWVKIDALSSNTVADTLALPSELSPDRVIDASLDWVAASGQTLAAIASQCFGTTTVLCIPLGAPGHWTGNVSVDSSSYLGLRFSIGAATHYGWARLSVRVNDPLVVSYFMLKDYAYNSVPDEPIFAGEGADISTGITRITHPNVQVTPNPFISTLSISIGVAKPGVVLCTVRSLTGQALVTRSLTRSRGQSSFTLDLSSLAPDIYMLDVMVDGDRIVRKVMKE